MAKGYKQSHGVIFGLCDKCGGGGKYSLTVYTVSATMISATWRLQNNWYSENIGNYAVLDSNNYLDRIFTTQASANTYANAKNQLYQKLPVTWFQPTKEWLCDACLPVRKRAEESEKLHKQIDDEKDSWDRLTTYF